MCAVRPHFDPADGNLDVRHGRRCVAVGLFADRSPAMPVLFEGLPRMVQISRLRCESLVLGKPVFSEIRYEQFTVWRMAVCLNAGFR